MTKYCPQCREVKSVEQFAKHANRPDGLQSTCKDCQHKKAKLYFQNNKAKFNERNKRGRVARRQFIAGYLKDKQCQDCGIANPVVLTFDHVRGKKVEAIANMVNRYYPLPIILEEIAKCEIRCFNCHMIKDHSKRSSATLPVSPS
jgi:hypothetical protein